MEVNKDKQKERDSYGKVTLPDCRVPTETIPDPLHQKKPVFCTRLHSYKDIRLGLGEQWAIEEGSLIIGVGSEYTLLQSYERRTDEFEVSGGDVYVVCSLYADLWALCAKVSSNPSPEGNDATRLAFLPLCAVTLAPNYSAFIQRSIRCAQYSEPHAERYPGNGLPVMPPRRSHSLTASNQIFRGPDSQMSLPLTVRDIFRSLVLKHTDDDFVPLDSTLEPILSTLTSRRWRFLSRVGRIRYSSKYRQSGRHHMRRKYDYSPNQSSEPAHETVNSKPNGWRGLRRWQRNSSWDSQKFKWLSWNSDHINPY